MSDSENGGALSEECAPKWGVCRACLTSAPPDHLNPFAAVSQVNPELTVKEVLAYVTKLQMLESSGLPEDVCSPCLDKVTSAYEMIIQCEKSELLLKKSIDCLYQRFDNIISKTPVQDNDAILVVLPESEIINGCEDLSLQNGSIKTTNDLNDNLFVFTLKRDGQLHDFDLLNLNHELLRIKNEPMDLINEISPNMKSVKLEMDEFNIKDENYSDNDEQMEVSESSDLNAEMVEIKYFGDNYLISVLGGEGNDDLENAEMCRVKNNLSDYVDESFISANEYEDINFENAVKKGPHEFDCTMCTESFPTKGELKLHAATHPKDTKHVCRICSRTYRKISILKKHYMTHNDKKKHVCAYCSRAFINENTLRAHMTYHQEKAHECTICESKFHFKHLLFDHLKNQHAIEEPDLTDMCNAKDSIKQMDEKLDCTMCSETFQYADDLKEHKKSHPEGTRHVCKVCGKSYLEVSTLRRHLIIHTGKKTYLCPVCGKSFFYRNVLKSHMVYHNEKKHKCHLCDKRFHMRHMLCEHIRMSHSNNRYNYMCEVCGKLCSSRRRFAIHKESHNTIYCPMCGKSYRNVRYYKQHLKTHNGVSTPKKAYYCDYCGENRTSKTLLELHILSKHLNERRYTCKLCSKAFFSRGSLNEHAVIHTRKKTVKCKICSRILVNKKALVLHNRLHTGERPYPCSMCDERFLSSSRRLAHIKSKHGERNEHCTVCPSKFYLRSDLNKHMLVHSKEPKKARKDFMYTSIV